MDGHGQIKEKITLRGESDGAFFSRTFNIVRLISEGADGICYLAYHGNSGAGVLKEFHLRGRDLIAPYEMLLKIKQKDPDSDLASFIPAFEIYYGEDEEGSEGSVYVWTPEPQLITFDRICDEIHAHPDVRPEHKLMQALSAIETLTKCICALHKEDIIHRDIKPSNFGFLSRGGEALTQAISMFDIDSLCSVWSENIVHRGTRGYMEPEAAYRDCSNQTDIYSIGATLFSAVVITEETRANGFIYNDRYWPELKNMVDSSELITASESNSYPRLRAKLTQILRRSLCARASRYGSCEEMLADIQDAKYFALPYDSAERKRGSGERWVLADVEKSLDAYADKNSYLRILYHLYKEPLYKALESGENVLKVLVAGFDIYSQKFLDACVQTGQMAGVSLDINVILSDPTDMDLYLEERPELPKFFRINGAACGKPDGEPYGDIRFGIAGAAPGARCTDEEAVVQAACRKIERNDYHYAFISLGSDETDHAAAVTLREAIDDDICPVCFVCRGREKTGSDGEGISPVYVNADTKRIEYYNEIERMALNTHLVWEGDRNKDSRMSAKAFRKSYNHDACVSSVIALKYKLHSIGIDMDACSPEEAAERYMSILRSGGAEQIKNELMWVEHRRWVTEKICRGWTQLKDLDRCAAGNTKDQKAKKHVCIVRSRPDRLLAEMTGDRDPADVWENLTDEEISRLDDLDRMSVLLHRAYVKRAVEITGSREAARQMEQKQEASAPFFRPVFEAARCRDWKQADADIIDSIPYILTNSEE